MLIHILAGMPKAAPVCAAPPLTAPCDAAPANAHNIVVAPPRPRIRGFAILAADPTQAVRLRTHGCALDSGVV